MKNKYPYNAARSREYPSLLEDVTSKQIWYINKLNDELNDDEKTLSDIMDCIDPNKDIEDLTKGEAMFVIKCLNGEIKPYDAEPEVEDIVKNIWEIE